MKASSVLLIGLALVVAMIAACSGGGGSPYGNDPAGPTNPNPGAGTVHEVHLTSSLEFAPASVTVARGAKVRWINDVDIRHTITPDNPNQQGAWTERAPSSAGVALEHTFERAGETYNYHCELHGGMKGVIRVSADADPGY